MIDWVQVSIGFVLGMTAGEFLRFVRVRRGGRSILRPGFERQMFDRRWLTVVLVVMFVVSTAQVTWWTFHQRQCNIEFQNSTYDLRRISTEDRELESRDDDLRNQRDDAMTLLVQSLITPTPDGTRVDTAALLVAFSRTTKAIDIQRDQLNDKRAELERQRRAHAVPPERC